MPSLVSLTDISEYHVDIETSLRLHYSISNLSYQVRFIGYFQSEVMSELTERLSETEMRSVLIILARIEAAFRVDYKARATSKNVDPISMSFRKLYAQKGDKARLEAEILETWRQEIHPEDRAVISQLRGMLKYRHWLAHGRYWHPGTRHKYQDAYLLADVIFNKFDLQG